MSLNLIRKKKHLITHGRRPGATGEPMALAKEVAGQLLERSIHFGHGRLSVIRLAMAVHCGAAIPKEQWLYCRDVAASSQDAVTQALFQEAVQLASGQALSQQITN